MLTLRRIPKSPAGRWPPGPPDRRSVSDDDRYDHENEETGTWAESGSASDVAQLVVELPGSEIVEVPAVLPVLPVRDVVVYPGVTMPLAIGRERSLAALDEAGQDGFLLVLTQRDPMSEDPGLEDLYEVGTIVRVMRIIDARREGKQALVVGLARAVVSGRSPGSRPCASRSSLSSSRKAPPISSKRRGAVSSCSPSGSSSSAKTCPMNGRPSSRESRRRVSWPTSSRRTSR